MERPERPSRHSKTHDKWKRIIEPAGDSDSSSDWSTENELMLRTSFYENNNDDGAGPSTSGAGAMVDRRESLMDRVRMRNSGGLPPCDISSLLARYGSDRLKRPAPPPNDHNDNNGTDPPAYHLLHHDYAERDADHNAYRDMQKYSMSRSHGGRNNTAGDFSYFLHSNSPNGERKRSRLHRHGAPGPLEQLESRANRTEPEDSDRELYIIRLPTPPHNEGATASECTPSDENNDEGCRVHGRLSAAEMKLKFMRRAGNSSAPGTHMGPSNLMFPSFFGNLPLLSERSTATIAAARLDAVSTSSAEVQVISMAGPSGATTPPRSADRPTERSGPGDDEIIVIVEDQHSPTVPMDTAVPQPTAAEATATHPAPGPVPSSAAGSSEDDSLNHHLITLLECPVCTEYMAPPIHQCRRGHLLCAMCKPKLPQCPTCRSRFTDSRNLAMEQVAERLLYPCKNRELDAGCAEQLRLKDKPDHEANCEFRAYHCTLPMCSWKGLKDAVFPHSLALHRDMLLMGSKQELLVNVADLTSTVYRNWLVSAYDELFRVNFVSPKRCHSPTPGAPHSMRQHVFGCVQYIGPRNGASRYKYTIETRCDDSNRCLRYTRNTHSDLRRCMNIYSAVDCFHMRGETAELLCERRDGAYHLPVVITLSLNASPGSNDN